MNELMRDRILPGYFVTVTETTGIAISSLSPNSGQVFGKNTPGFWCVVVPHRKRAICTGILADVCCWRAGKITNGTGNAEYQESGDTKTTPGRAVY
jgi:hypothetical protein